MIFSSTIASIYLGNSGILQTQMNM